MLAGAREVGGVLAVHAPTGPADAAGMEAIAAAARATRVPLLVCAMGETTGAAHRRRLADAGRAGVRLARAGGARVPASGARPPQPRGRRELPPSAVLRLAPDRAAVAAAFARARAERIG